MFGQTLSKALVTWHLLLEAMHLLLLVRHMFGQAPELQKLALPSFAKLLVAHMASQERRIY